MFHSRTLSEKTEITGFHGRPDGWGVVVRTVTASPKRFIYMTTFGHKIAAASDDGRVDIYDSFTGVLRLSLNLADPVQAISGSPDGSTLFCAHKTPSITVWDIQTGGLIHTFHLEQAAEDIAVSLKGHYLAYELSNGSVEVWGVTDKVEGPLIWTSPPFTHFCWLQPEEWLAVSAGASVDIRDIIAGTVLRSFSMRHLVHHMVYSQKFNQLAITVNSTAKSTVTIINPQMDAPTPSHLIQENFNFSCLTFSQTTEELVCGMETHGLQLFNISRRRFKYFEHPDTFTSISSLQNGTVVANSASSGIQLLSLDGRDGLSQQPTVSALTIHVCDKGRIIAIFPTSRDRIIVLEMATMSQLLEIPVRNIYLTPADHTTIFCASYENLTAVFYFEEGDKRFLQSWRFHEEVPRWTVEVDGLPSMIGISPTTIQLETLAPLYTYAWDAQTGQPEPQIEDETSSLGSSVEFGSTIESTSSIELTSDIKFTFNTESYRQQDQLFYALRSWSIDIFGQGFFPFSVNHYEKRGHLSVDDTHEWVVSRSGRVCWIPPGYIGSIEPSYCWVGSSLIMVGQDGMLRKLTFQGHPEE